MIPKSKTNTAWEFWEPKKIPPYSVICSYLLKTDPSIETLSQMNEEELACVEEFRVWNSHGEVHFIESVDLR